MIKRSKRHLEWIFFVSRRFSKLEKESRFAALSILPKIGIAVGVLSLIVILSVMNGFQLESINSILEVSSYHVQASVSEHFESADSESNLSYETIERTKVALAALPQVQLIQPFLESQALLVGKAGRQSPARIRALSQDAYHGDKGFQNTLKIYSGKFDLESPSSIVLGSGLAQALNVRVGDTINILALAGSADVDLFSNERLYVVRGLFYTGYGEINTYNAFLSFDEGRALFGPSAELRYGIKLKDSNHAAKLIAQYEKALPSFHFLSWESFHTSFFQALRLEKNVLLVLVLLIFFVVAINIYNGMKKMVFERKEEIAVFHALGSSPFSIQTIFILNGLETGFVGSSLGLLIGLFMTNNIDFIFILIGKIQYAVQYIFLFFSSPTSLALLKDNSLYTFYASIPAQAYLSELIFISLFGLLSAVLAAWAASRAILRFSIAEVLRDE